MIAVIAGKGFLPIEVARKFNNDKKPFFIISLFPEDNLDQMKDATNSLVEIIPQDCYKAGTILSYLKERKATSAVLIGKVEKNLLLKKVKFDWLALKLLTKVITKSDSEILETIVSFMESEGIGVLKQSDILNELMISPGIVCGNADSYISENVDFGINMAKEIAKCDIGQTIVIKDKMVIAVEAIEGTDSCIERGIKLGRDNVIVCKVAKITQNKKFDLPTLGPYSISNIKQGQIAAIAWDSKHTLIVDKEKFISMAIELGITLISV